MTKALAARLRELSEKATPGPWHLETDYPCSYNDEGDLGKCALLDGPDGFIVAVTIGDVAELKKKERANAKLLVELRNALPAILTALEGVEEKKHSPETRRIK